MKVPFDKARAEKSLIRVQQGPREWAMGFRIGDDALLATACHCLQRVEGKVAFPDPDRPGGAFGLRVRAWGGGRVATSLLVAADPCGDLALVSDSSRVGIDLPGPQQRLFSALMDQLEPTVPVLSPSPARWRRAFVFTRTGKWLGGRAFHGSIHLENPKERVIPGTSGAPVFDEKGRVLGVISTGSFDTAEAQMALLADCLPGWAIQSLSPRRRR